MDTTALAVGILADALDVPVQTDIPLERPSRLVMVWQESDQSDRFILRPTYAITCWGRTDVDARGIAISALHALSLASETHPYLSAVEVVNLVRDEWTANGQARYVLTVELTINTDE